LLQDRPAVQRVLCSQRQQLLDFLARRTERISARTLPQIDAFGPDHGDVGIPMKPVTVRR
jgi:hypothetical protein